MKQYNENTEKDRFLLLGTLHGGLEDCTNNLDLPTIFTRIDHYSILSFVWKIVFDQEIKESSKEECQSFNQIQSFATVSNLFKVGAKGNHFTAAVKLKLKKRNAAIIAVVTVIIVVSIVALCVKNNLLLRKKRLVDRLFLHSLISFLNH